MNWLDTLLLLLLAGASLLGMARGFGRAAFDALGLYAALCLASFLAPMLAAHLTLTANTLTANGAAENRGLALGILFVLCGALFLGVAWYCHGLTRFEAGLFDKLFGLAGGAAMGVILAHGLVATLVTADPQRLASAACVSRSAVGAEVYSFPSYHSAIDAITGAASTRRGLPDVAGK